MASAEERRVRRSRWFSPSVIPCERMRLWVAWTGGLTKLYHVRGVATWGANMAVRTLLVLAVFAMFYGCGQSSSPPEQGEKEGGGEPRSMTPPGTGQQETRQQGL